MIILIYNVKGIKKIIELLWEIFRIRGIEYFYIYCVFYCMLGFLFFIYSIFNKLNIII